MRLSILLAAWLATSATTALAADPVEHPLSVAFDAGQSYVFGVCDGLPANVTISCQNTSTALRLALDYQIDPVWGVELAYVHFAAISADGTIHTTGPTGAPVTAPYSVLVRIRGTLLAAVATVPLTDEWSAIAKFGDLELANINVLVETPNQNGTPYNHNGSTNFSLFWGLGVMYKVSPSLSLRAQYEDFGRVGDSTTGRFGVSMLTGGVVYRF